jgi:hypothetical protein
MSVPYRFRLGAMGVLLFAVVACGGATPERSDAPSPTPAVPTDGVSTTEPSGAGSTPAAGTVPEPGTMLDACEIVTAADVQAAFGAVDPVATGEFRHKPTNLSPGYSECTYAGGFGRIIIGLTPEDGANLYDAAHRSYKDIEPIDGIGDDAFWSATSKRGFVWQDRVAVMFTIYPNAGSPGGLEVTRTLGAAVIDKL